MDTKLTLKLDKTIIERAKVYAANKQLSLSKMIENYLSAVVNEPINTLQEPISPYVRSISTGKKISADLDYKTEYGDYLSDKYK